ncbi:MAG: lactate utilization protein [Lachnospiraceae bacterium]|nr:lactate utilization protein [Lachnospiraceae bacterium]
MSKTPEMIRNEKAGACLVKALEGRCFEAYYCETKEEAKEKALSLIPEGDVISWGGCGTAEEIGLMDEIQSGKYKVIDRATGKDRAESLQLMRQGLLADTYIAGTNAISEDGQLVNIDGTGNRVAAMTFGPSNIIVVAGMNKVAKNVEDALTRARSIAAPINCQRFPDKKTPCVKTGLCGDCNSPDCICNYISTIRRCSPPKKIKVILIGEKLGF